MARILCKKFKNWFKILNIDTNSYCPLLIGSNYLRFSFHKIKLLVHFYQI